MAKPLLSNHEVHAMAFAPAHQFVAAEAGIPAQNHFHLRPRDSDLPYDPFDFRQAAKGGGVIGVPETRAQDVFPTKNIERLIAVCCLSSSLYSQSLKPHASVLTSTFLPADARCIP
jgi:hypothetical protein